MYATLSSMIKHRLEGIIVQFYYPSHLHPPPSCIALPMHTFLHLPFPPPQSHLMHPSHCTPQHNHTLPHKIIKLPSKKSDKSYIHI